MQTHSLEEKLTRRKKNWTCNKKKQTRNLSSGPSVVSPSCFNYSCGLSYHLALCLCSQDQRHVFPSGALSRNPDRNLLLRLRGLLRAPSGRPGGAGRGQEAALLRQAAVEQLQDGVRRGMRRWEHLHCHSSRRGRGGKESQSQGKTK